MSDSRERFEAWLAKEFPGLVIDYAPLMGFYRGDDGFRIGDMWDGWQAAERDALERAAKACRERAQKEATLGRQFAAIDCECAIRALARKK